MKYLKFTSFDNTILQCYLWDEVKNPSGIVQIVHGMAEHARRYDAFAKFLNKNGYVVFADDHRAHGNTEKKADLGYHDGDIFADTVKDEIEISRYLKNTYPSIPLILLGHSYGSFLSQSYIQQEDCMADGVILSGSACMKGIMPKLGGAIAGMQYKACGGRKTAKLMDKLSFGSYNKPFKKEGVKFAWLNRDHAEDKKYFDDEQCGGVMSIAFYKYFMKGLAGLYGEGLNRINKALPIAIFSGGDDPVGGGGKLVDKLYGTYKDLGIKDLSVKLYDGARHEILLETNRDEVYADMLAFINRVAGK